MKMAIFVKYHTTILNHKSALVKIYQLKSKDLMLSNMNKD